MGHVPAEVNTTLLVCARAAYLSACHRYALSVRVSSKVGVLVGEGMITLFDALLSLTIQFKETFTL